MASPADLANIHLEHTMMNQTREAHEKGDDWTGLTNPTERRKRQNRLHQRAWRRRKAAEALEAQLATANEVGTQRTFLKGDSPNQDANQSTGFGVLVPIPPGVLSRVPRSHKSGPDHKERKYPPLNPHSRMGDSHDKSLCATGSITTTADKSSAKTIPPLIPYLTKETARYPVTGALIFPLPLDQRLIILIQFNVLRAMMVNMSIMSLEHIMPEECRNAFALQNTFPAPDTIPSSLEPTALQKSTPHGEWIDLVPVAALRENLILHAGKFDEDDLCCDLCGGLYEGLDEVEKRGIIAWSDPWCADGWEVTEGFAKKWGFLLRGCRELIDSTNRWRARRGEGKLIVEI